MEASRWCPAGCGRGWARWGLGRSGVWAAGSRQAAEARIALPDSVRAAHGDGREPRLGRGARRLFETVRDCRVRSGKDAGKGTHTKVQLKSGEWLVADGAKIPGLFGNREMGGGLRGRGRAGTPSGDGRVHRARRGRSRCRDLPWKPQSAGASAGTPSRCATVSGSLTCQVALSLFGSLSAAAKWNLFPSFRHASPSLPGLAGGP